MKINSENLGFAKPTGKRLSEKPRMGNNGNKIRGMIEMRRTRIGMIVAGCFHLKPDLSRKVHPFTEM